MIATERTRTERIKLSSLVPPGTMGCDHCLDRLSESVAALQGVQSIEINRQQETATVALDPEVATVTSVEETIRREGETLGATFEHQILPIEGMDCADCARTLERGVARLPGVSWANVNFAGARMSVEYASDQTTMRAIEGRITSLGYRVATPPQAGQPVPEERSIGQRMLADRQNLNVAVGLLLIISGILADFAGAASWLPVGMYVAATLIAGLPVARKGLATLRATHRLDINVLMTIAVIGAAFIGKWLEGATVVVLFSLGEALERYTMDRARQSIRSLMSLAPVEALLRTADGERRVPVGEITPGDIVIVRPGDRLPVDGVVTVGASVVNQAPVTGESIPVEKSPDSDVFAGTINGSGVLEVRATRPASDSTIARIIRMVEDAQAQKAPTERFIDTFAMYYTPAVVVAATLLALIPPLMFNGEWSEWIYRALVLLVIACPCALVISTPVSIVAAISAAARNGVLIKGGAYLEAVGSLRALAFDKTGTLTLGQPEVASVVPLGDIPADEVLRIAAVVERYSEHPLGAAIVAEAESRGLVSGNNGVAVDEIQAHVGRGIEALVNGVPVRVGTRALVLNGTAHPNAEMRLGELERSGQTAVLVRSGDDVIGIIGLADQLRPEASDAVAAIRKAGIRETVMLTGDRREVARTIGDAAGVDTIEAELMPDQKVATIEELLRRHGSVGMIGDGVNDAPALARATVGIAMGAAGTDTALETADVALMSDDLSKLGFAIRLSRSAKHIIMQNIVFSLAIKVVFLGLAVVGVATLWEAIVADVGASLIVIANGMRLLRQRPE